MGGFMAGWEIVPFGKAFQVWWVFYEQRVLAYTAWSEDTAWDYIRENSEMDGKYSVVVKEER